MSETPPAHTIPASGASGMMTQSNPRYVNRELAHSMKVDSGIAARTTYHLITCPGYATEAAASMPATRDPQARGVRNRLRLLGPAGRRLSKPAVRVKRRLGIGHSSFILMTFHKGLRIATQRSQGMKLMARKRFTYAREACPWMARNSRRTRSPTMT